MQSIQKKNWNLKYFGIRKRTYQFIDCNEIDICKGNAIGTNKNLLSTKIKATSIWMIVPQFYI